jgi:hypothetical protein
MQPYEIEVKGTYPLLREGTHLHRRLCVSKIEGEPVRGARRHQRPAPA